ncbi:MAG: hypothetical protein V4549_17045 [Bacteroidota bacterium]
MLKKFKKRLIVGIGLTILSSCTHYIYIYKSQWSINKITVDGKLTEWQLPLKFYDDKSKLQYAIANDNENLYLCIRATDEQTQMKMFAAGMQVLIDTSENSDKSGILPSILFPQGKQRGSEGHMKETMMEEKPDMNTFKNRRSLELNSLELAGFNPHINDGIYPLQNDYGISASIVTDSNKILSYEAVIPFKTFYKNSLSLADSSKIISVTIVLNGLSIPGGGMHGGPPPGGRGMNGGSPGGMGGGSMSGGGNMGDEGMGSIPGNANGQMNPGMDGQAPAYSPSNGGMSREYLSEKNTIKTQFQFALKR